MRPVLCVWIRLIGVCVCVCVCECVCVCVCVWCAHWGSICWFSTPLIFHRVILAVPAAICFYYPAEYVCLRISIIINKAMTLSPLPLQAALDVSHTRLPPCSSSWLRAVHIFQCVIGEKQTLSNPVSIKPSSHRTVYTCAHINPHTERRGSCLDWVCALLLQTVITVSHPVCP